MATLFHVIKQDGCVIKCHYCEKEQKRENILRYLVTCHSATVLKYCYDVIARLSTI